MTFVSDNEAIIIYWSGIGEYEPQGVFYRREGFQRTGSTSSGLGMYTWAGKRNVVRASQAPVYVGFLS